ncbi:MAG: hypothetical protein COB51_00560 [Moraxellaceae bacterium]|nr:MAG: hypothetical protein COB51_00560 [Moraxellaceae bacterium]
MKNTIQSLCIHLMVLLPAVLLTLACSSAPNNQQHRYEQPQNNAADVAIIKGVGAWFTLSSYAIKVKSVDGEAVSVWATRVVLLPGDHVIEVTCQTNFDGQRFFTRSRLDLFALPGKTYYLESRSLGDHCEVSAVEG